MPKCIARRERPLTAGRWQCFTPVLTSDQSKRWNYWYGKTSRKTQKIITPNLATRSWPLTSAPVVSVNRTSGSRPLQLLPSVSSDSDTEEQRQSQKNGSGPLRVGDARRESDRELQAFISMRDKTDKATEVSGPETNQVTGRVIITTVTD